MASHRKESGGGGGGRAEEEGAFTRIPLTLLLYQAESLPVDKFLKKSCILTEIPLISISNMHFLCRKILVVDITFVFAG